MKTFLILASILFFSFAACSGGTLSSLGPLMAESDDPSLSAEQFRESYAAWVSRNIQSYTMVISWSVFSPMAGIWEIEVVDGRVRSAHRRRNEGGGEIHSAHSHIMGTMTMERLFELAAPSRNPQRDQPFIVQARFHRDGGVASVRRIRNPALPAPAPAAPPRQRQTGTQNMNSPAQRGELEVTFALEVLEFRAAQR